jgi:hypothetical protein
MGRQGVADVAAAGPEVEGDPRRERGDHGGQPVEVGAAGVDGAGDIGRRLGAELALDEIGLASFETPLRGSSG